MAQDRKYYAVTYGKAALDMPPGEDRKKALAYNKASYEAFVAAKKSFPGIKTRDLNRNDAELVMARMLKFFPTLDLKIDEYAYLPGFSI